MPSTSNGESIRIRDCEPAHLAAFRDLNLAWIRRYFRIEPQDRLLLDDPQRHIVDIGGTILVAVITPNPPKHAYESVLGTCALIPEVGSSVFELCKMCVDERFIGQGIGYLLGKAAIERARQSGASELRLETNSQLTPAIRLYEKLGFSHSSARKSPYARADVQMSIDFCPANNATKTTT